MPEALDGNELAKIKEVMNNLERFHDSDSGAGSNSEIKQEVAAEPPSPTTGPEMPAPPPRPGSATAGAGNGAVAPPPPRPAAGSMSDNTTLSKPLPAPAPGTASVEQQPAPEKALNPEPDTVIAPIQPPADSGGPFAESADNLVTPATSDTPPFPDSPLGMAAGAADSDVESAPAATDSGVEDSSPFPNSPLGTAAGAADSGAESAPAAVDDIAPPSAPGAVDNGIEDSSPFPDSPLGMAETPGADNRAAANTEIAAVPSPDSEVPDSPIADSALSAPNTTNDPLAGITPLSADSAADQGSADPAAGASPPASNDPFAPPAAPGPAPSEPSPVAPQTPSPPVAAADSAIPGPTVGDVSPFADPGPEQPSVISDNPEPGPMGQSENQAASAAFSAARTAPPAEMPTNYPAVAPEDILYAIADSGPSATNSAADTVMTARQEAQQLAPEKTLRKKAAGRVKFEALDFDAIVPNHPLVIASYSPSGGVGKSSTAMNLGILIATIAENMAQQQGEGARVPRVLTLDGDIVMGSLSLRLTSKVEPNLYDLQKYIDQRTAAGFQGEAAWPSSFDSAAPGEEPMYKFTHWPDSPSNFSVLAAPSDPSHFWHFGPDHYRNILRMLGRFYDVIIIDCGTDLVLDSQRAWLSHANEVFLITSPDSDRLYNCAKAARIIASSGPHPQDRRPKEEQKNYPPLATREKLSLVVTRYDSDSGLKLDLLVDKLFPWLDEDQKFWIPDVSQDMTRANNTGRFLVKENQEYAEVINRMAKHAFHRYVSSRSMQPMA